MPPNVNPRATHDALETFKGLIGNANGRAQLAADADAALTAEGVNVDQVDPQVRAAMKGHTVEELAAFHKVGNKLGNAGLTVDKDAHTFFYL